MKKDSYITQRVTGAMVLIALAVVFLPLILDGQKKNQLLESKIPDKPISGEIILVNIEDSSNNNEAILDSNMSETNTTANSASDKIKTEAVISNEPIKEITAKPDAKIVETKDKDSTVIVSKTTTKSTAKSTAKPKPIERSTRPAYNSSAYVIQLGSFGNQKNAKNLVDKLKAAGYKAYLRSIKSDNTTINRVLVGPELKRDKAESKIQSLNKLSGLKAIIVSYDPLRH